MKNKIKPYYLVIAIIILVLTLFNSCSTTEPPLDNYTYYVVDLNNISSNTTTKYNGILGGDGNNVVVITDLTGLTGLLSDDQHVLDVEVISAIENASPLTLPEFTLGDTVNLNSKKFDAGSTDLWIKTIGSNKGMYLYSEQEGAIGLGFIAEHVSSSPAINDDIFRWNMAGRNDNNEQFVYGYMSFRIVSVTDGSEEAKWRWLTTDNGSSNLAMELYPNGSLYIDGTFEVMDKYDDAVMLSRGFRDEEKQLLKDIGVLVNKRNEYTNEVIDNEYMLNTQKLLTLLAGGVYQNRDKIDKITKRLDEAGIK